MTEEISTLPSTLVRTFQTAPPGHVQYFYAVFDPDDKIVKDSLTEIQGNHTTADYYRSACLKSFLAYEETHWFKRKLMPKKMWGFYETTGYTVRQLVMTEI